MNFMLVSILSFLIQFSLPHSSSDNGAGITIYPNPARDHFMISNTENMESIVIYNLIGKPIKTIKDFSSNRFYIDGIQDGTYLVQFNSKTTKNFQTSRLTKRNR